MIDLEKNLFIGIVAYKVPVETRMEHMDAHRDFVAQYAKQGVLITAGPFEPYTGGMVIGKAESKEAFIELWKGDPFNQLGFYDLTVYEFRPAFFNA